MRGTENKAVNREFQEYYLSSSLLFMKRGFAVTIFLFAVFGISTQILFPDSASIQYLLRFGSLLPFMVIPLIAIQISSVRKQLHTILTVCALLTPLPIFFVGTSSNMHIPGYQYYFTWVMLVIIGTCTFYRIRLFYVLLTMMLIIAGYSLATIFNHHFSEDPLDFLNKLFFVIATSSVGYFISFSSYRLIYNNFLHKKDLDEYNEKLKNQIHDRILAETALQVSEKNYKNSLEALPDWIHVVDRNLRLVFMNAQFREINRSLGLETNVVGKHIAEVFPFIPEDRVGQYEKLFASGEFFVVEEKVSVNGTDFFTETRLIPIYTDNVVTQMITVIRDIAKKKEIEALKLKNVQQKELLLKEIHHRVKNNLAIVISLLDMQIRQNPNPVFIMMARDIEFRIRSMALIHEHLYKSDELDRVPIDRYLFSLASNIIRSCNKGNIQLSGDLVPVDVTIEAALPLGLIANEILTNACKYAFPDQSQGKISIDLIKEGNTPDLFRLTIRDNGIGLPEGYSVENKSSLGVLIIKLLVDQLDAKLEIETHMGTSFSIIFSRIGSNNNQ